MVTTDKSEIQIFRDDLRRMREAGMTGGEMSRRFQAVSSFTVSRNCVNNWIKGRGPMEVYVVSLRPTLDLMLAEKNLS